MGRDEDLPVADDDFAEFGGPPRHRPEAAPTRSAPTQKPAQKPTQMPAAKPARNPAPAPAADTTSADRPAESQQEFADQVFARLRRERAEGKR